MGFTDDLVITLIGVLLITIIIVVGVFAAFYKRATKNMAFIRTGWGGEHVVISDGALVLPILHEFMPVNMQTFLVKVERKNEFSLITKDPLRVNVMAEFRFSIPPDDDMIKVAARTLERRTLDRDDVQKFVEEQCVAALRSAASKMKLDELHQNRKEFEKNVEQAVVDEFRKNGLLLASVSLVRLDQTSQEYLDPNNAFDAQGLTLMQKITSDNEKQRNSIMRDSEVSIQQKDLETEKKKLNLELEEFAAQKETEKLKAEHEARTEKDIEKVQIDKEVSVELAKQDMEVARSVMEKNMAEARISSDRMVAEAARVTEEIATAREQAEAERQRIVEVILAEKEAQRQTIIAEANAEVERLASTAAKLRYDIEAAGKKAMNKAANELSAEQIKMQVKMEIVRQLPEIMRESVKPMENIDSIKVMQLDGLSNVTGGAASGGGHHVASPTNSSGGQGGASLPDQVVNSALRYRAHLPLMESLLKEVDIPGGSLNNLAVGLQEDLTETIGEEAEEVSNELQGDVAEPVDHGHDSEPEVIRPHSVPPVTHYANQQEEVTDAEIKTTEDSSVESPESQGVTESIEDTPIDDSIDVSPSNP